MRGTTLTRIVSMRAVTITAQGQPVASNVRVVDDWAEPEAQPGGAIVRTEASALNQLDLTVGRGVPGMTLSYPRITGADGCGVVEAVGDGVDEAWLGRRVLLNAAIVQPESGHPDIVPVLPAIRMIGEHIDGTLAERFAAPITNLLPLREETDPVQAAAFGLTHLTAWRMLRSRAGLRAGQTLLITGIGGGVALACLNIARHLGCRTIVTSRHQWKLDRALELGADDAVLDTGEDWSRTVRGFVHKRGVDVCADSVGKAIHTPCLRSLARGGVFVTCGATSGFDATTDLGRVFWNQLTIIGSTMGDMAEFRQVTSLLEAGAIMPVVDSVHEGSDARAAYERLESGDQFGKVLLRWS